MSRVCFTTLRAMFAALAGDRLPAPTRAVVDNYASRAPQEVVLGVYDLLLRTRDDELLRMSEELMDSIDARYLLVHGADPGQEYVDWLTTHLPTATIEVWPDTGHFLRLVEPERFVHRILDFLSSCGVHQLSKSLKQRKVWQISRSTRREISRSIWQPIGIYSRAWRSTWSTSTSEL